MSGPGLLTATRNVSNQVNQQVLAAPGRPVDSLFNYPLQTIISLIARLNDLKQPPELRHEIRPANAQAAQTATVLSEPTIFNVPGQEQVLDPETAQAVGALIEVCAEGLIPILMAIYHLATSKDIKVAAKEAIISQRQLGAG